MSCHKNNAVQVFQCICMACLVYVGGFCEGLSENWTKRAFFLTTRLPFLERRELRRLALRTSRRWLIRAAIIDLGEAGALALVGRRRAVAVIDVAVNSTPAERHTPDIVAGGGRLCRKHAKQTVRLTRNREKMTRRRRRSRSRALIALMQYYGISPGRTAPQRVEGHGHQRCSSQTRHCPSRLKRKSRARSKHYCQV